MIKQGVAVADVYQTLQAFLGGIYVNQFNRFGRQWRVFLQAEAEDRVVPEDIGRFYVRNDDGDMLPLSTVVTSRRVFGPEYTQRFNLFRAAQVTGQPAPGYSSGQAMAALEEVAHEVLPPEMGYDWADLSFQERRAAGRSGIVFGLSLGFVFLILAALYESWSLPFSVLLSVPVAVVGAFLGLWGRGLRARRLRADRPRDADRAGGQERDPHRGVREGRLRAAACRSSTPLSRVRGSGCVPS